MPNKNKSITLNKPAGQVSALPAKDNRLSILKLIHYNVKTMYFYIFIKKMTFIWRPADKEITTELENNGHTLEYAPKEAGTFWGEVISNIYEDEKFD